MWGDSFPPSRFECIPQNDNTYATMHQREDVIGLWGIWAMIGRMADDPNVPCDWSLLDLNLIKISSQCDFKESLWPVQISLQVTTYNENNQLEINKSVDRTINLSFAKPVAWSSTLVYEASDSHDFVWYSTNNWNTYGRRHLAFDVTPEQLHICLSVRRIHHSSSDFATPFPIARTFPIPIWILCL